MGEYGAFESTQLRARLEARLLGQNRAGVLKRPQRVALATAPEQRNDQLSMEPLPQRMGADQAGQLHRDGRMVTRRQLGVDEALMGSDDELVQARRGVPGERVVEQPSEGRTTDQGDCGGERCRGGTMIGDLGRVPAGADERLQPDRVDPVRIDGKDVAGHGSYHRFTTEQPSQMGHQRLQGVRRVAGLIVTPQLVDQSIIRNRVRHRERKDRQQGLKLGPGHRTRSRPVIDLDRAEQRHRNGHHDSTFRSSHPSPRTSGTWRTCR